ncbi:MAG: DUF362 domain-containing protein [Candidatus Latescibacteria bacterium]|nr:DUF362 domain-containing protein [Candidatus Latescibacterota bacterium]NIO27190.1 DUF362 domain-containing protein [Candidatus Latescibacterota bacterium]NIO54714.1 DUF362 domain-containing protein [Candidatus Latescibacterota bacterium]NIT00797.1 DUF362 domain-containing protein [Candidatus Latescibacterota bacterium]NIT37720.1 DUF362 domain-containing protein [Candidatus Latescibacterota bacterium]
MKPKVLTRREFLKSSTSAAIAGALFLGSPEELFAQSEKKARVVLIRNKDVLDDLNNQRDEVLQEMLDEAVMALLGENDPIKAWKRIIAPDDKVGIKTNVWSYLATPRGLEKAIKRRVMDAGVSEGHIGIKDRGVLGDSRFRNATALINTRPLRTHHWSGVGSLIKNYIMFVRSPSDYHDDSCADLAKIWKLPIVSGKTRLNILVLLTPLFHGLGPHHYSPKYVWTYKGLLVGSDPVAVDSTGVRILLAKRRQFFGEERPLSPPPKHVFLADTRHHLGTADPEKIDLIRIGWKNDILI